MTPDPDGGEHLHRNHFWGDVCDIKSIIRVQYASICGGTLHFWYGLWHYTCIQIDLLDSARKHGNFLALIPAIVARCLNSNTNFGCFFGFFVAREADAKVCRKAKMFSSTSCVFLIFRCSCGVARVACSTMSVRIVEK